MEFTILGPLEVRQSGRPLPCKGAKQRLLLAVLVLHANEVVSSDRLIIQQEWGSSWVPIAPRNALISFIRAFEPSAAPAIGPSIPAASCISPFPYATT